jgi:hypothetical protein
MQQIGLAHAQLSILNQEPYGNARTGNVYSTVHAKPIGVLTPSSYRTNEEKAILTGAGGVCLGLPAAHAPS